MVDPEQNLLPIYECSLILTHGPHVAKGRKTAYGQQKKGRFRGYMELVAATL